MEYLDPNEQDDLKGMLYSYLKDKAQRRAGVTSKADYEGAEDAFGKQMQLRDTGALLGGLSEAASMAGQIQGKRAESDIIPKVNQDLYGTTQGAYENFRTLRDQEERSNMNDLNIARYLKDVDAGDRKMDLEESRYRDLEPRRRLELQLLQKKAQAEPGMKKRFEKSLLGPDGLPVVLDEAGNPTQLPKGFRINEKLATQDQFADLRRQQMEAGIERTRAQTDALKNPSSIQKPLASSDKARLDNVNMASRSIDSVEKFFTENKPSKGVLGRVGSRFGNMTTMGSTDYDLAADMWEEAIGRMQSGGAITNDEGVRFRRLFPTFEDSPEMIQKKIQEMRLEMSNRRNTLGQGGSSESPKVRVRNKQTGKTGTVSRQFLDPQKYEVIE